MSHRRRNKVGDIIPEDNDATMLDEQNENLDPLAASEAPTPEFVLFADESPTQVSDAVTVNANLRNADDSVNVSDSSSRQGFTSEGFHLAGKGDFNNFAVCKGKQRDFVSGNGAGGGFLQRARAHVGFFNLT